MSTAHLRPWLRGRRSAAVAGRPFLDLGRTGRLRAYLRLARRPPAMVVVDAEWEAPLLRALGIRPVFADRAEAQTRRSRPLRSGLATR